MKGATGAAGYALRSALLLSLLSFVLVLPALVMGDALSGDAPVHVLWQAHFAEQVWSGVPYPRWLPNINEGFGSPSFFFYPPMIQWFGALFHPILPGVEHATSRLILGVGAISAVGGVGCWYWLRALKLSAPSALIGSLIFLLMPYRAFVDVYQRGAVAEMAGICIMPWLLCFATKLKARTPGAWGGYALATGAILYSHLPAAEMGILLSTAYILLLAGARDWRYLVSGASATIVGFMIAAMLVATALGLLGYLTDTTAMWGARNQPMNWLLFSATPWIDPSVHLMTLGLSILALLAAAVLTPLALASADAQHRSVAIFLCAAILVVFVLNTAIARPFWALQTPLSRIQFPFRLLSIHVVAIAGLGAIAYHRLEGAAWRHHLLGHRLMWLGVVALFLGNAAFLAVQNYRNRSDMPPDNAEMTAMNIDTSEYVLGRMDVVRERFGSARSIAVAGAATTRPVTWESRNIVLEVNAATEATLALRVFAFTGWECRVDRGPWIAATTIAYPLNVPACAVPVGQHRLEARLPPTALESAGRLLTSLGLLLAVVDLLRRRPKRAGTGSTGSG